MFHVKHLRNTLHLSWGSSIDTKEIGNMNFNFPFFGIPTLVRKRLCRELFKVAKNKSYIHCPEVS
jgi:hypothetical protein